MSGQSTPGATTALHRKPAPRRPPSSLRSRSGHPSPPLHRFAAVPDIPACPCLRFVAVPDVLRACRNRFVAVPDVPAPLEGSFCPNGLRSVFWEAKNVRSGYEEAPRNARWSGTATKRLLATPGCPKGLRSGCAERPMVRNGRAPRASTRSELKASKPLEHATRRFSTHPRTRRIKLPRAMVFSPAFCSGPHMRGHQTSVGAQSKRGRGSRASC